MKVAAEAWTELEERICDATYMAFLAVNALEARESKEKQVALDFAIYELQARIRRIEEAYDRLTCKQPKEWH